MRKLAAGFLALLVVMSLAIACGGREQQTSTTPPAASADGQPQAASDQAPTAMPTPVPPTPEPTDAPLQQLGALSALRSYRAVSRWTTKGVGANGSPVDEGFEAYTEYVADPPARHSVMRFFNNADPSVAPMTTEVYEIGQDVYLFNTETERWARVPADQSPLAAREVEMIASGDIFDNLDQMKRVRPDESINGVNSRHYQFDHAVLGRLLTQGQGEVKAKGDVWIAKDGNYVTKYQIVFELKEGGSGLTSSVSEGVVELSFELRDVNSNITIELPGEAKAGVRLAGFEEQDFPTPPDAQVQMAGAEGVVLLTAMPVSEAAAYYEATLAEMGWTKNEDTSASMEGMSMLNFEKDGLRLSLVILVDSTSGKTQILASPQQ